MSEKMSEKRTKRMPKYITVIPLEIGKGSIRRMSWRFSDTANIKPSGTLSIAVDTEKWWTTSGQWWYLNLLTLESDKPFATIVKIQRYEKFYGKGENRFVKDVVMGCLENPDNREIETMVAYANNCPEEVKRYMEGNKKYIPPSFLDSPQNHLTLLHGALEAVEASPPKREPPTSERGGAERVRR
jgi:hypothetical protein